MLLKIINLHVFNQNPEALLKIAKVCLCTRRAYSHIFLRKFRSNKNYYDMLGVSRNSTAKELKAAFYEKSKKLHPDRTIGKTSTQYDFVEVKIAYETLTDVTLRMKYDSYLRSIHCSTHSFQEWMSSSLQHHSTYNESTNHYRSHHMSNLHQGRDDQWSDFTYKDILLFGAGFTVLILVYLNERKKPVGLNPFSLRKRTHAVNKTAISTSHLFQNEDIKPVNVGTIKTVKAPKVPKQRHSKNADTFEKIKSVGKVTDKDIEAIKRKYPFNENAEKTSDVKTWVKSE